MSRRSKSEKVIVFAAGSGSRVVRRISRERAIELESKGIIERAPVPQLSCRSVIHYDATGSTQQLGFRLVGNARLE